MHGPSHEVEGVVDEFQHITDLARSVAASARPAQKRLLGSTRNGVEPTTWDEMPLSAGQMTPDGPLGDDQSRSQGRPTEAPDPVRCDSGT